VRDLMRGMVQEAGLDYMGGFMPMTDRSFVHVTMIIFDTEDAAQVKAAYDVVLDLVRALYAPPDADARAPRRGSDLLRAQIREYIDAHLADRDLTPSTIAGDHFISRSYLDRLFEGEDAGVWETIRTRRLDRARRDLVDEGLAGESILEIATRWGFASASHFSRSFRAAYGRSPRDVRQAALPQA
jgi:AraC-like DNA-binding protein